MHPELFDVPFIHVPLQSYGLMMVIGFLSAVGLIRYLSRDITPDPQLITNAALYSLIAGVVGARVFYVIHYFNRFQADLLSVFAIWQGGLELLGGVILAIVVIAFYLRYHRLPIRHYLDILAIALMLALAFGRIGCFFRGCCYGKPADLPWAIRFPYGSPAYYSQVHPDVKRNRARPQLQLPQDFFTCVEKDGLWYSDLKPYEDLTGEQKSMADKGPYRCLPVHPAQLYSSAAALFGCSLLYLFWRRSRTAGKQKNTKKLFARPGCTFGLMFAVYGTMRFLMEFLRDDNPFEQGRWAIYKGGTISQNMGIYMAVFGIVLMLIFQKMKPANITPRSSK